MLEAFVPSFTSELVKISVSSDWVKRRLTRAMAKGVSVGRYTEFADRMVSKADRTFDKALRTKNYHSHDNYNEALDTVQKWNPYDFPEGKGIKTAASKSKALANAFHKSEVKDWPGFEKDLKNRHFQKAMLGHEETDPKLQKYVKNYGGSLTSKSIIAFAPSRTDKKAEYKIKVLPSGRLSCECKDWQYHHSVRKTDCDHIKAVRSIYKAGLVKKGSALSTIAKGMTLKTRVDRAQDWKRKGDRQRSGEPTHG